MLIFAPSPHPKKSSIVENCFELLSDNVTLEPPHTCACVVLIKSDDNNYIQLYDPQEMWETNKILLSKKTKSHLLLTHIAPHPLLFIRTSSHQSHPPPSCSSTASRRRVHENIDRVFILLIASQTFVCDLHI